MAPTPQAPFPPPPPEGSSAPPAHLLAGTAYLGLAFCFVPTLAVLIWQWADKDIRFHGLQALAYGVLGIVVATIFPVLSAFQAVLLGDLLGGLLSLVTLTILFLGYILMWVVMTYRVYTGHSWVIPVIGPLIQKRWLV